MFVFGPGNRWSPHWRQSRTLQSRGSIVKIGSLPKSPCHPKRCKQFRGADYIIIGPGSLYTSVIPLLVPEIAEALAQQWIGNSALLHLCLQLLWKLKGYTVSNHQTIDAACGQQLFSAVLVHKPSPRAYHCLGKLHPIFPCRGYSPVGAADYLTNVMDEDEGDRFGCATIPSD